MKFIEVLRNACENQFVDELLTVEQAAARLQMHPVTVRRLLREGKLPGRKVGPRQWRISADSLAAYMVGEPQKPPISS